MEAAPVSIRLPRTTLARLDRVAATERRTRSNLIVLLIEAGLLAFTGNDGAPVAAADAVPPRVER